MPRIALRVVWGTELTIETFAPHSAFSNVDLPTEGLPTIATNADLGIYASYKMLYKNEFLPASITVYTTDRSIIALAVRVESIFEVEVLPSRAYIDQLPGSKAF